MFGILGLIGKVAGFVTAILGFFRERKIRRDGAREQAHESLQKAVSDEKKANDAAMRADADVAAGRLRDPDQFTRAD